MLLQLMILMFFGRPDFQVVTDYEAIPEEAGFLEVPFAVAYSPQGELFVLDSKSCAIFVWNKQGKFSRKFGKRGEGPGEWLGPDNIWVTDNHLYLYDFTRKTIKLDHNGKYLSSIHLEPHRAFAALADDRFLTGTFDNPGPKEHFAVFEMFNPKGESLGQLKRLVNETYITPIEDTNDRTSTSYRPDVDIQPAGPSLWYFGYGKNGTLYRVNQEGKIIGEDHFKIPTDKPTEDEITYAKEMSLPLADGSSVEISKLKRLKFDYSKKKGHYTHFLVKEDKVAFIRTALGGFWGTNRGVGKGVFYICDRKSGKTLSRGDYNLEEEELLFFRDGRVFEFSLEDEDYQVKEVALPGF